MIRHFLEKPWTFDPNHWEHDGESGQYSLDFHGQPVLLTAMSDIHVGDWDSYYRLYSAFPGTRDIVLLVYDRANMQGFECSTKEYLVKAHLEMHKNLLEELRRKNTAENRRQANCVFALVGMQKYENDEPTEEEQRYWKTSKYVSSEDGEALAKTIPNCRYFEVVLSTGAGVDDVFEYVLKNAIKTVRRQTGANNTLASKIKRFFKRSTTSSSSNSNSNNNNNSSSSSTTAASSTTATTTTSSTNNSSTKQQADNNDCSSTNSESASGSCTASSTDSQL